MIVVELCVRCYLVPFLTVSLQYFGVPEAPVRAYVVPLPSLPLALDSRRRSD